MRNITGLTAMLGVAALGTTAVAMSATLNLTNTVTATGTSNPQTYTVSPSGLLPQDPMISTLTQLNLGNSVTLSNSNANFTQYDALTNPLGANGSPFQAWNFQDDYYFGTANATVQSAVIALTNIGGATPITDLQARIIFAAGNAATGSNPVLGPPAGGVAVNGWQSLTAQTITFFGVQENAYAVTMPKTLSGGQYILQIRGEGALGATTAYGGAIGFIPVPLPAALPLLLSGVGGLGFLARRRRLS